MGHLTVHKRREDGRYFWLDFSKLTFGDVRADSLSREDLWRRLSALKVRGLSATDGAQGLLEKWAEHLADVAEQAQAEEAARVAARKLAATEPAKTKHERHPK